MSVEDYFKKMEMAMMRTDVQEDLEATMARVLYGLKPEIAELVELQHYLDISEMLDKAVNVKRHLKRRSSACQNTNYQAGNWRNSQPRREEEATASISRPRPRTTTPKPVPKVDTKVVQEVSKSYNRDKKCFKYQGFGHISSQCSNQ